MTFELITSEVPHTLAFLDIGGEGRYPYAWNLNPSRVRTLGPSKGSPIPRHIQGKAEAIPLQDGSVELIVMERTPLRRQAVHEILRVISNNGTIVLRHFATDRVNPHIITHQIIRWPFQVSQTTIGRHELQQTIASAFLDTLSSQTSNPFSSAG